jgi:hypothetical protein
MITLLLGAALLLSISTTAVYVHRKRKARRRQADDPMALLPEMAQGADPPEELERPLHRCRPEDVILCEGQDWMVEEVIHLSEGAREWVECRLSDGSDQAWLVVPEREEPGVGFGRPVELPAMASPGRPVEAQSMIFSMDRQGSAVVEQGPEQIRFWDYERAGAARLWHRVPEGDGPARSVLGERLPRHQITLLPGS